MEETQQWPTGDGNNSSGSSEIDLLKKKMMERMSFDMPSDFPSAAASMSLLNGTSGSSTMTTTGLMAKQEGFSVTREIKAVRSEQAQMHFVSARSTTAQQQTGQILHHKQSGVSLLPSTSSTWMTNSNIHGEQRKEMTSSSTISSSSSCASATATSAMEMGITRSFSSSSGFPTASISSGSINSEGADSGVPNSHHGFIQRQGGDNFPSFGGSTSLSPFKGPFRFRNFDRPLFTDIPLRADNQGNRMTWDPAMLKSMRSSSSQVQFSASQHTFFEANNGSIR